MAEKGVPVAGMGEDVPLLSSLNGVLTTTAAAMHAITQAANNLSVVAERQGHTYGSRDTTEVAAIQRGATSRIMTAAQGGGLWIPTSADKLMPASDPSGVPKEDVQREDQADKPDIGKKPLTPQETYDHYRNYLGSGNKPDLRNVRQAVGQRILSSADRLGPDEQLTQAADGTWLDAAGNVAAARQVSKFLSSEKVAGAVRGFGGGLAQGKTVAQAGLGTLPMSLAKGAGVVGAVATGVNMAGDFFEGQRAANNEWQAIYGGTNVGATGERFRQKMFGLSQFGFMDSDQAQKLYSTVSKTGMSGQDRQMSLDFATDMYGQLGMSIEQSTKLIEIAAKTGQESLSGVAVALTQVSESAVEAGVNAEKAREKFIQTFSGVTAMTGGGTGSAQLAGAISGAEMGMGREFQGVSFGFTDQSQIQRLAATTPGMDYNAIVGSMGSDPMAFLGARMGQITQDVQRAFRPGMYGPAKELIQARKAAGQYDPTQLAQELLQGGYLRHITAVRGILSAFGIQASSDFEASVAIVGILADELDPVGQMEEQQESMRVQKISVPGNLAEIERSMEGSRDGGSPVSQNDLEMYEQYQSSLGKIHEDRGLLGFGAGWMGADVKSSRVSKAYKSHVQSTGEAGGLAGHIAGSSGAQSEVDKVLVQTSSGPKVVSIWEAIEHYGSQVNRGELEIIEGGSAGQTLAETFGGYGDSSVGEGIPDDAGVGQAPGDYEADAGVVLGLTPEARRILQVAGMSGMTYNEAWQPTNPHVTSDSLATGNP